MASDGEVEGADGARAGQGDRPAFGVRYVVERVEASAERVVYRGHAHLPAGSLPLEVRVALPGGATEARLEAAEGDASQGAELQKAAAALVRAATKAAVASGKALPRKIVRWRG